RIGLACISILGILAHHDIVDFVWVPDLDQFSMNLVLDARVKFHGANISVQIELLSVENYLSESRQLRLRIGLAWLCENRFSLNLMSNCPEQDRVGRLALFEGAVGPFGLVLDVVMAPAGNLFDPEIDSKQLASDVQNAQRTRQDLRADSITGQRYDVIGLLWCHRFCSRKIDYKRACEESTRQQTSYSLSRWERARVRARSVA